MYKGILKQLKTCNSDVERIAKLIGVKSTLLSDALTQPCIQVGQNVIRKNQNLRKVCNFVENNTEM